MRLLFSLFLLEIKIQSAGETVMKPAAKAEDAAPEKKAEAEKPTSVGKADGEKSVPASKAAVSLCF